MQTLEELPSFDYTDPAMRGPRFHAEIAKLRERTWLARGLYGYIVLDREAGEVFLRTRAASFPGRALIELLDVQPGPLREEMSRNILHIGGADHTRLRSLLNPSLSPRAAQRHRPAMRELLSALFAEAMDGAEAGETVTLDAVPSIAKPYPAQAIAHVMGAPIEDAERLNHWSMWVQRQFDVQSMTSEREQIEQAVVELYEYLHELLAARRGRGGDDLLCTLLEAEAEGQRLSEVECVNLVLDVLIGGVDTTQSQLAHALRLLAEHPEQWAMLAERPGLAGAAVEEVLRYAPVTPFTARIVEQEIEHRGVVFEPGTIVMVCAQTANRDMDAGERPEVFDIAAARPKVRILTFGAGIHYCVGANLARAELEEALSFLAPRMRDLRPAGEPEYGSITGIYGLTSLPVAFELR